MSNIKKYITNTKEIIPEYWDNTLKQRLKGGAGSRFTQFENIRTLEEALLKAEWVETTHPDVDPTLKLFKTKLQGHFGLVKVKTLPIGTRLTCDDRKGTGQISLTIKGVLGPVCSETYLIVGPEQGTEVVYTVHPGEPIKPSTISSSTLVHGQEIDRDEAISLGFIWAKVVA